MSEASDRVAATINETLSLNGIQELPRIAGEPRQFLLVTNASGLKKHIGTGGLTSEAVERICGSSPIRQDQSHLHPVYAVVFTEGANGNLGVDRAFSGYYNAGGITNNTPVTIENWYRQHPNVDCHFNRTLNLRQNNPVQNCNQGIYFHYDTGALNEGTTRDFVNKLKEANYVLAPQDSAIQTARAQARDPNYHPRDREQPKGAIAPPVPTPTVTTGLSGDRDGPC